MPTSSSSPALQFIDAIAIAIAQGYILARARLTSHPSPILRLAAVRDAIAWDAAALERELIVFRQKHERISAKQRPHYAPTHRLPVDDEFEKRCTRTPNATATNRERGPVLAYRLSPQRKLLRSSCLDR